MRVTLHPPVAVAAAAVPPSEEGVARLHARVALEVRPAGCNEVRRGHLQLLRGLEAGAVWRPFDLGGRPLARVVGDVPEVPADAPADLERWLARQELVVYSAPRLGALSELGEDRQSFRARLLATMRPELVRLMTDGRADDRRSLASAALGLVDGIEEIVIRNLQQCVRDAELGILLLPHGIREGCTQGSGGLRSAGDLEH